MRERDYGVMDSVARDNFVVIDDIGAGHDTEFAAAKLDEIADLRLGKWTVFTTNMSSEEVANMDARVASRMLLGRSRMVSCDTMDWNLRKLMD